MLEQLAVNARFKGGTELCETLKNHYGIDRSYPTVQKYLRLKNKTKINVGEVYLLYFIIL
jgi:hypothetical protein